MSLTLLYRGQNVRFSLKLSKPRWLTIVVSFAVLSGLIIHLTLKTDPMPEHLQASMPVQQKSIAADELTAEQINALTMKLADLQSNILRLNALGERLAEEADIPKEEFNMAEEPSSGGPMQSAAIVSEFNAAQLSKQILNVESLIEHKEKQLKMLESVALGHHIQNNSYLSGRPIGKGWLSSYYGVRKDPFNGKPAMHKGVDFAGKEDADVIATGSGVVTWSDERYGYGNLIEIDHGTGYKTRYGHNKALLVKVGDVVSKGQVIALMGSTGRSTGPHVHYEILKDDKQINPIKYVYRKSKK
ncbi:M23 family metallopeptidase [Thalassomonas sp. M1454]|uniref:M23 family metallopeptidase n=1 Tax=Thalassomonas sp. M1454 TaxID=2594477 RepID=UPI0011807AA3|nr:M23 family metallopeptidase [Thalassomonas sp. M1454]TRX52710.1 peptidoglycan DD-metalloendopeptidase family protein [Thalassomonas sp. M1454]